MYNLSFSPVLVLVWSRPRSSVYIWYVMCESRPQFPFVLGAAHWDATLSRLVFLYFCCVEYSQVQDQVFCESRLFIVHWSPFRMIQPKSKNPRHVKTLPRAKTHYQCPHTSALVFPDPGLDVRAPCQCPCNEIRVCTCFGRCKGEHPDSCHNAN